MKTKEEIEETLRELEGKRGTTKLMGGPRDKHIEYIAMIAALKWVLSEE